MSSLAEGGMHTSPGQHQLLGGPRGRQVVVQGALAGVMTVREMAISHLPRTA